MGVSVLKLAFGEIYYEPRKAQRKKEESSGDSLSVASVLSVVKHQAYAEGIHDYQHNSDPATNEKSHSPSPIEKDLI